MLHLIKIDMKEKLKTIQVIHLALTFGCIIAYYMLGDLNSLDKLVPPAINTASIIYILIPVMAFGVSNFLFKNFISKIDTKLSLEEKFGAYQTACIIRWAVLEGAAFFLLIIKPDFLIFGILLIVYLASLRPTAHKIKSHLNHFDI